ncbi:glycosyl transferase family 1 [Enterobacter cloacae subsp. cloacae]|nr:glycosyl transferase family 1 [Enterobacter cloacae subsp. cloacae]
MSSIRSITLALISLSAGEALYTRAQGLGVALAVLFMLVAFAAWLFERYM